MVNSDEKYRRIKVIVSDWANEPNFHCWNRVSHNLYKILVSEDFTKKSNEKTIPQVRIELRPFGFKSDALFTELTSMIPSLSHLR